MQETALMFESVLLVVLRQSKRREIKRWWKGW
jgi:hypothetical protein